MKRIMKFLKKIRYSRIVNKINEIRELYYLAKITKNLSGSFPEFKIEDKNKKITNSLPKNIWMYWHEGLEKLPDLQKSCYERIKILNPNWKLNLLSLDDSLNLFPEFDILSTTLTPQSYSDLLRITLLKKYGGVWCDATLLMTESLDFFLEKNLSLSGFTSLQRSGYTTIQKNKNDYEPYTFFIVSEKNCPIINYLYEGMNVFLKKFETPANYFWLNIFFSKFANNSENFRNSWLYSDFYDGLKVHLVLRMIRANKFDLAVNHLSQYPFHKLKSSLNFEKVWPLINYDGILDNVAPVAQLDRAPDYGSGG